MAVLGPATIGEGTALSSCALLEGKITIGKQARIDTEALVICRFDLATKKPLPITIGAGATIDPGVLVTMCLPARMWWAARPTCPATARIAAARQWWWGKRLTPPIPPSPRASPITWARGFSSC